ncbi:MAG TPA: hypothetical protein VMU80_09235 [Bryobacteraceae bacterium]|nr:hypothetical protein [Bryobacteraceae bacterium]
MLWNTLGGDTYYDLWLAQNPDATLPINGPADTEAGISIPLSPGTAAQLYIFGQRGPGTVTGIYGLNLFFDGNNSAPGISVFGATGAPAFSADASSTFTLAGAPVAGAGQIYYTAADSIVVVEGYIWDNPATPPGDVCQAFSFIPGNGADYFGSIQLRTFPAATLSANLPSAAPGTSVTLYGGGFQPSETVDIYAGSIGTSPIVSVTADSTGAFTVALRQPPAAYGPQGIFALGQTGELGATTILVIPDLAVTPRTVSPGDPATVDGFGFGAGELADVYWSNPRQLLGTATTNASGSFVGSGALKTTIPLNSPSGSNAITAIGQTTGAVAVGRVTVK